MGAKACKSSDKKLSGLVLTMHGEGAHKPVLPWICCDGVCIYAPTNFAESEANKSSSSRTSHCTCAPPSASW